MTAGHGVMKEGAATRGRAGSTRVVTSGVLTRIGVPVRRDVVSGAQGVMTAVPAPEAGSVMTAGAATAPTGALVPREVPSAGRTVIGTIAVGLLAVTVGRSAIAMIVALGLRAVPSVGRSGIGMIVVPGVRVSIVGRVRRVLLVGVARTVGATIGVATVALVPRVAIVVLVVRVVRVGLRSVRGTIAAARRAVSAGRSGTGMIVVPGVRAPTGGRVATIAPIVVLVVRVPRVVSVGRSGIVTIGGRSVGVVSATIVGAPPVVSVGRSGIGMIVVPGVRVSIVGRVRRVLLVSVARTVGATTGVATVALVPRVAIVVLVVRMVRAGLRSARGTIAEVRPVVSVGRSGTGTTAVPGVKASTADLAARAATAPTGDLVLRAALSVGRSGIVTTGGRVATSGPIVVLVVRVPRVVSVDRTVIAMIVGRAARVARVGLRSVRGTIEAVRPVVSAGRSGMTVVPAGKADIRAMTGRGRSHGTHVMSVPTVAPARGTAGTTVRRTPRRASRCPSLSRTSRLTSSTRKCARSSGPCPTTWRSWSAGT
ncbi:hypothetical protein ACIBQX_38555 [Nonomuraea sp. NPDC049714]|uniref:hypothetical protein n=1 Tax=Nonomuraea sp. NPDC049714 TaxID=3364357 RepID=UPI0037B20A54